MAYKNFMVDETKLSSTWRELYAIYFSLLSFKDFLIGKKIQWHTDNFAASVVFTSGSNKMYLQELCEDIFKFCKEFNIDVNIVWVPREDIPYADALSKQIDYDDWTLTEEFFAYLNDLWGPFSIDRFADSRNAKVFRFNSKHWCPGTEGVNAFSSSWSGDNNLIVPPVYLVPRVIKHMKHCKAKGTLIVPFWRSATFWPFLLESAQVFKPFVKEALLWENSLEIVTQGLNKKCFIGSPSFKSPILGVKIDFSK